MKLLKEIQVLFANSDVDSAYPLSMLPPEYPAWVVRFLDSYGVAVPYDGGPVNEEFANAYLYATKLILHGKAKMCLILTSNTESSRNEFATFCSDFVSPGENGEKRNELVKDPVGWWKRWKTIIGNSISEKHPYAVLGELIMYEHLLRNGNKVSWEGPKAASHDLICPEVEYEVKSTLSRYEKLIHITGQYQLQKAAKRLFLYFCRFEKNINGISIDDVVERLIEKYGESREEIDGKLGQLGYSIGNSARKERYRVLEILQYSVDERFPRIIPEMFKQETLPKGIKHLSYDVDLSLLKGESVSVLENRS